MNPATEMARGLAVTAIASSGGGMLGAALLGLDPLGGLGLWPFTLFGSFAVLLPSYLWGRDWARARRAFVHAGVLDSGLVGGLVVMALFLLGVGGSLRGWPAASWSASAGCSG